MPLYFRAEGVDDQVLEHFGIEGTETPDLSEWEAGVKRYEAAEDVVRIGLVGKYTKLEDAYLSVIEALGHGGAHHGGKVEVRWIDSEQLTGEEELAELAECDGILIPGGFGVRGIEGKIRAARYARERGVPYLGICLGMQIAVADFARHVAGMDGANSTEFDPETPFPVVDLLPEQKEVRDMGGTMRLGADPVKLHEGSRAREIYGEAVIYERHRHRYEVNNHLRKRLEREGLVCSGTSPDDRLVEVIELPDHPFFVASQFHPEFKSRPLRPQPLFREFVGAALERAREPRARGRALGRRGGPRGRRSPSVTGRAGARASAEERERLAFDFVRLCEIESPSLQERAVADAVAAELRAAGLEVEEDAQRAGRGLGVRQPPRPDARPRRAPARCSCARTWTPSRWPRRWTSQRDGGVFRNRNEAILGADNKAAVAVLLGVARRLAAQGSPVGVELLFTTAEELALRGREGGRPLGAAQRVRLRLRPRQPDRRDHRGGAHLLPDRGALPRESRPTPGSGRRAGATRSWPPPRRSSRMRIGRLDEGTTANAGLIEGGTAANVVAEHARARAGGAQPRRRRGGARGERDGGRLHRGRQRHGL